MIHFSVFKGSKSKTPVGQYKLEEFIQALRLGTWARSINTLRSTDKALPKYKYLKNALPAVTVSGLFKTRKQLSKPTGLICIDIDKKDNPKLKTTNIVDKDCLAQFVSCSGEGIKIIYRCTPVTDPAQHRRVFDAAVERLAKIGLDIKADPIVKSLKSLQYVSFDPNVYFNSETKLVLKPLAPIKKKDVAEGKSKSVGEELKQLEEYVEALGSKDITSRYEEWMTVMFGLSYSFGEKGRAMMHRLCSNYKNYSAEECDEKYDACLEKNLEEIDNPVTIASVFQLVKSNLPKVKLKKLNKKYNAVHNVGQAQEVEGNPNTELNGLVRYRLFLFKKHINKKTKVVEELTIAEINLNAFEELLRSLGFFRFEDGRIKYVRIVNNVVERVDTADILRIITEHIEKEGDYNFVFQEQEFSFSWEELVLSWRRIRGYATTWNQIAASLTHWEPNLLKDTAEVSFIPYLNGILKITAKDFELIPYDKTRCEECNLKKLCNPASCKKPNQQIWKERILPREFKYVKQGGMFEEFFANVTGRGKTLKERVKSSLYNRALWYFGYMLQGVKRKSMARAWFLYDIHFGNSGRTGKSIIGEAVGKIRNMVTLDGKHVNFHDRFAFQSVDPWTDVVFIDDPSKFMSIVPLFNKISGNLQVEKKNRDQISTSVKFMFASNWIFESEGNSEIGRQFVTQLDDFYVRYGKENKDTITPILDYHGKEFFTEWDEKDWNQFDSFALRAVQHHLKSEAPTNTVIGNTNQLRFIQVNDEELFFELCSTFVNNVQKGKDGSLYIAQPLLISVVKEHTDREGGVTRIKAGHTVKEFLRAIEAKDFEVSSIKINNMIRMAYKIKQGLENLDFGIFKNKLPKGKI